MSKSPAGGEGTGKSPTDRAKLGWKWSILTDARGIPFGWTVDGANWNDSILLEPTLVNAAERGLLSDIETIWLDRGYDSDATRKRLADLGIHDAVIAKRRKRGVTAPAKKLPMGLRWPVERTNSTALELRRIATQHRPQNETSTGSVRSGRHLLAHRQAHRLAEPVVTRMCPYPLSL
jgi:transposase